MGQLRVAVIDDDPSTCAFLKAVVCAEGHLCESFLRAEDAEHHFAAASLDLALVDIHLGTANGLDLLARLRQMQPGLYPVIMTAHVSMETAARSVAEGAVDYLSKPLEIEQIRAICERAQRARLQARQAPPAVLPAQESAIIGRSAKMLEVYKAIGRVAPSNANVFITGASGTGKELVARAIHRYSRRAALPFTAVNCGSFTETILESELFGHEKGAFTGAHTPHKGLVEATDGGTLFLDEVTETSLSFQVKLLRVIQEQKLRRVGSNRDTAVDVRILAATNRDVSALLRQGQFREDLFYRLSVVQIAMPSLHERRDDIPLLVVHFLQQFNARNLCVVTIEAQAIERLQEMQWPGNVRELENTIYRLAIFTPTGQITLAEVDAEVRRKLAPAEDSMAGGATASMGAQRLQEIERLHIMRVLKEAGGNKSEAARRLGIERKTLYRKSVRLGVNLQATEDK